MESLTDKLSSQGYWPATAATRLDEGKYSDVVTICRDNLKSWPGSVSGRVVYATALYRSGQTESATEEFRHVLSLDPENMVALKYLGDSLFAAGDTPAAIANYSRIMELDPWCRGLKSDINRNKTNSGDTQVTTRTITLTRGSETKTERPLAKGREIPFYTETMGDLYLAQGYPQMAAEVFGRLHLKGESPRLAEKLAAAERKIKEKES